MKYDAIVIGGGLGGLSAGAILARHGNRILLLEQHYIPGGCATTFKRREFVMEVGLHAMDGHLIHQESQRSILRFLGIHRKVEFLPLPEFFRLRNSRMDFVFPQGRERAFEALSRAFPNEKEGIRRVFRILFGVQDELLKIPRRRWKQILVFPLFPLLYPCTFKASRMTVGQCLDRYIGNEDLKLVLQGNLLYYHDDPYSMALGFFAKAQASFIQNGGYYVKGGSQTLSDALANVIRRSGGTLLLGKRVTRILTEQGKASGVIYRDAFNGKLDPVEVRAPCIIFGGAIPLVKDLLQGTERKRFERRFDRLLPSCSLTCVYLGFNEGLRETGKGCYSNFFYGDEVRELGHVHGNNYGDWHKKSFVFVDYGRIDTQLAPAGKSVGVLCAADRLADWEGLDEHQYRQRKEEIAGILINRLEEYYPGIRKYLEFVEVATPMTIRRYTLNPAGAPYGFAQVPAQSGMKRQAFRSPVRNLWLAGTWTFPGGGFTGALVSGFMAGLEVHRMLEKRRQRSQVKEEEETAPFADPSRALQSQSVKLIRLETIADKTLELTFEKAPSFEFLPGQYAFVSLDHPAFTELDMPVRSLSMVSHPDEDILRFVMRVSESGFKKSCAALKKGDTATLFGPAGDFTMHPGDHGMVFLVAGIGISPVLPMLRELEKQGKGFPVCLFYSNRTPEEAAYHRQLGELQLEHYRYIPVYTRTRGRINEELLRREIGDLGLFDYYIVGSSGFLENMTGILHQAQVPESHIHVDDFG
jgi:all-trans-retinol 13,14-reductase